MTDCKPTRFTVLRVHLLNSPLSQALVRYWLACYLANFVHGAILAKDSCSQILSSIPHAREVSPRSMDERCGVHPALDFVLSLSKDFSLVRLQLVYEAGVL